MANPLIEVGTGESRLSKFLGDQQEIDRLARESGPASAGRRRTPKLTARNFLAGLLQAAATGQRSLRPLALWCGLRCYQAISRQNLFRRISDKSSAFLRTCLALVITKASREGTRESLLSLPGVRRILAADSCVLPLHDLAGGRFPRARNQSKRIQATAKVQCVLDLLTGAFFDFSLGCFRNPAAAHAPCGIGQAPRSNPGPCGRVLIPPALVGDWGGLSSKHR